MLVFGEEEGCVLFLESAHVIFKRLDLVKYAVVVKFFSLA